MTRPKIERVGIYANLHKTRVFAVAHGLLEILKDVDVLVEQKLAREIDASNGVTLPGLCKADMVITLGGDGTVLSAAREFSACGIAILGINMGRLGFLTELLPDELGDALPQIIAGNYTIDERMMIDVTVPGLVEEPLLGFNEATIDKGGSPRALHMTVSVSNSPVGDISADGFIVATPTGSTAYSMATGGAIVEPHLNAILLTALAPYTLAIRPLIVSDKQFIEVKYSGRDNNNMPHLTVDGQVTIELPQEGSVVIKRSAHTAKLIKFKKNSFYDILRTKLGWGPPPPAR